MNSSLVSISTLVKSNIGEKCLINLLMNVSLQSLRDYLRLANIYWGISTKSKIDLIEMIINGYICKKINKDEIGDILINKAKKIINENNISIKFLAGYGNAGIKKKDMSIHTDNNKKSSINLVD